MPSHQPTVLLVGSTGETGRQIVNEYERVPGEVRLRFGSRVHAEIEKLRVAGKEAVHLDLGDPQKHRRAERPGSRRDLDGCAGNADPLRRQRTRRPEGPDSPPTIDDGTELRSGGGGIYAAGRRRADGLYRHVAR